MERKFKLGDSVQLKLTSIFYNARNKAITGKVIDSRLRELVNDYEYHVKWGQYGEGIYHEKDLQHIKIKNTVIARKLNPDYKVDGEWLIKE